MDKPDIKALGKALRKEFEAPDHLPFPMRKALEQLAVQSVQDGSSNDNGRWQQCETENGEPQARNGD